jgi:hypothetical protein
VDSGGIIGGSFKLSHISSFAEKGELVSEEINGLTTKSLGFRYIEVVVNSLVFIFREDANKADYDRLKLAYSEYANKIKLGGN